MVLVNGEPEDRLSLLERGWFYGDGFFTTLLVQGRRPLHWSAHWQRLLTSAERLGMDLPSESVFLADIAKLMAGLTDKDWRVMKWIVTRGEGGRGYAPPASYSVNRYGYLFAVPDGFADGLSLMPVCRLMTCKTPASTNAMLAGLKHLNRLDNVLARQEVMANGMDDGIMLDALGRPVGSTQANLVIFKAGEWLTPLMDSAGIEGTGLQGLKALLNDKLVTRVLALADIQQAQAVLLVNAVRGVQAVDHWLQDSQVLSFDIEPVRDLHQAWWRFMLESKS
jgi:4-amino-4-deoxychorismate lyase